MTRKQRFSIQAEVGQDAAKEVGQNAAVEVVHDAAEEDVHEADAEVSTGEDDPPKEEFRLRRSGRT